MKKNITLFFMLIVSIFLIGCSSNLNISINTKEEGEMSFSITIDDLETIRNNTPLKSREDIESYLKDLFPSSTFKEENNFKKEITYVYNTSFSSLEDLKEKLGDIKISGYVSLFKNIEVSEKDIEGVYLGFTTERLTSNKVIELDKEVIKTLSLNIEIAMPYDIAEYLGGELKSESVFSAKINDLTRENEIHVYCDEMPSVETNTITITVDKKNGASYDWYISESLENQELADKLALEWGFEKFETEDENIFYYNKSKYLNSYESFSNFVVEITKNANPMSKDNIFNDFSIVEKEEGDIELKASINNLAYKNNVRINVIMPQDIVESKGGNIDLQKENFYTCFVKNMATNELYVKSNPIKKEGPGLTRLNLCITIAAVILFNIIIIFSIIKAIKENNKKNLL